jgi:crossover junction endodeoxyribonuclease RusA
MIKRWRIKWAWEFVRYKSALQNKTHFKISFAPPDKRRRDLQNCSGAFKAGIDALSDVVCIDDSKFRIVWNPDWLAPVEGGAVFIEVME